MYCSNCGAELLDNPRFCVKCGAKVKATVEEPPAAKTCPENTAPKSAAPKKERCVSDGNVACAADENVSVKPAGKKSPRRKGSAFLAVLLCIAVFICAVAILLVSGAYKTLSEDSITGITEEVLGNIDGIPLSDFSGEVEKNATLVDVIIDLVEDRGIDLKGRDVENLLSNEEVVRLFSKMLYNYLSDIRYDEKNAVMDEDDFRDTVENIEDLMEEELEIEISDSDITEIVNAVEETGALEYTRAAALRKVAPGVYYGLRYGTADWMVWAIGGLTLLLAALLLLAAGKSVVRMLRGLGISVTLAGVLVTGTLLLVSTLADRLLSGIPGEELVHTLLECGTENFTVCGVWGIGIGVLLIVVSVIVQLITGFAEKRAAKKQ